VHSDNRLINRNKAHQCQPSARLAWIPTYFMPNPSYNASFTREGDPLMLKGLTVAVALLLSGCSLMHKQPPAPQTLHYRCGTLPLTVTLDEAQQQVSFIMDGQPLTLKQTVSASGTRYSDGHYAFWSKGNGAFIERNDKVVVNDCELQPVS